MTLHRVWMVVFGALALALVVAQASSAKTPDGVTPAEETVCDGLSGAAFGLCNAYCEAQDCDVHDRPSCSRLRRNYERITGTTIFPCDGRCGDGILDPAFEECDDGNNEACDGCAPNCRREFCGDGVLCDPPEECETDADCGNGGEFCTADCQCEEPQMIPCELSETPICGGECPPDLICAAIVFPGAPLPCMCLPELPPCELSGAPVCGGACPDGLQCTPDPGGFCFCDGGQPLECGQSAPACDGECPAGANCIVNANGECGCVGIFPGP